MRGPAATFSPTKGRSSLRGLHNAVLFIAVVGPGPFWKHFLQQLPIFYNWHLYFRIIVDFSQLLVFGKDHQGVLHYLCFYGIENGELLLVKSLFDFFPHKQRNQKPHETEWN